MSMDEGTEELLDCGCIKAKKLVLDPETVNLNCYKVWRLLATGKNKGIFQVDSGLGRKFTKLLAPTSIEDISAVISIVRPGVLEAEDENGKSMAVKYCDRKNLREDAVPIHPSLEYILKSTQQILIYQESVLRIAADIAGLSLQQADSLRRALGKKLPEVMAKCKKEFIEGCLNTKIVNNEEAGIIFDNVEKSQRYLFNKCVPGYSILWRAKSAYPMTVTIEEMYYIRNSLNYAKDSGHEVLRRSWMRKGNFGKCLSLHDDNRLRPNFIEDIQPAGLREVFRITLENGLYIDATENHKFPTPNGEKLLSNLTTNDLLYIKLPYEMCKNTYAFSKKEERQVKKAGAVNQCFGDKNISFTNGSFSEFIKNDKIIPLICNVCGITDCRLELHHKDGNRSDSSLNNLQRLCVSCHKIIEYKKGRTRKGEKGYPTDLSRITSIISVGEHQTYDVSMEAPNHTFVINDIVTCNSHAIAYALDAYLTALAKVHYPLQFYTAALRLAYLKIEPRIEVKDLIQDARNFNISVLPPDLRIKNPEFQIRGDSIIFSLGDIKGLGESVLKKVLAEIELLEKREDSPLGYINWTIILTSLLWNINSIAAKALILSGAMDFTKLSRTEMLFHLEILEQLSPKEIEWLQHKNIDLHTLLSLAAKPKKEGGACSNKNRVAKIIDLLKLLENPPRSLEDSVDWTAWNEESLLGIALSVSKVEGCAGAVKATATCEDFKQKRNPDYTVLGVTINKVREHTIKSGNSKGQIMAFLTVEDSSGELDSVIAFTDIFNEFGHLLTAGNTVLLRGERSAKKDSFVVNSAYQI